MRHLLLVCCACSSAAHPAYPVTSITATPADVVVNDVFISTPSGTDQLQATVQLTVEAALDCPPAAFGIDELEGSILGSYGIDRAVTYYVARVDRAQCTAASSGRPYVLSTTWARRSDTPWTIAVAPHRPTGLFVTDLAGHVEGRPPRADAIEVAPVAESLTNAPRIAEVQARREGASVVLDLELEYGNPCSAENHRWRLTARTTRIGEDVFVWGQFERGGKEEVACGEIYSPTNVHDRYRFTIGSANHITIAIPNVRGTGDLPVFRQTL